MSLDLQAETVTGVLPLPSQGAVLDVSPLRPRQAEAARAAARLERLWARISWRRALRAPVSCALDARLPLATADDARRSTSCLRCASLPRGNRSAPGGRRARSPASSRGSRLLCSVDYDATAGHSRGRRAHLFDVRVASCAAAGSGSSMLWEQPVRGDISCFHCREERFVGTATGGAPVVVSARPSAAASTASAELDTGVEKREKREKWRAKVKVRGRFPKMQGFSNSKGFGGFSR